MSENPRPPKEPTSTTIKDADRARELQARQVASRRAAREARALAATPAATPAIAQPQRPPTVSAFINPQVAANAAQANALAELFRLWPLAAGLRVHRLAPAWCRGYLEDTDQQTVDSAGGIHRYLADTWGGERYRVELIDAAGVPMGPGWAVSVVGAVRHMGAVQRPPSAEQLTPTPAAPVYAPQPAPVYAPPAPPVALAPAPSASAERQQLVALVVQLTTTTRELVAEVERLRASPPGQAAAPGGDLVSQLRTARATIQAAQDFQDEIAGMAPTAAPQPNPDDDDRHGPVARGVMRDISREIGRSVVESFRKPGAGGIAGAAGGAARPPAAAPSSSTDSGADVVDAEVVH